MADVDRQRDLLPLPSIDVVDGDESTFGSSRCAGRRTLKRAHIEKWAEECRTALNEMAGRSAEAKPSVARPTLMQRCALRNIVRSVAAVGPPPADACAEGALRELLANKGYSGQPVALAPLDVGLLSLPGPGMQPLEVAGLLGDDGCGVVERFVKTKLLPKAKAAEKLAQCGVKKAYMDPGVRRDKRKYAQLLRRLEESGMIEWQLTGEPNCGLFTVWKKASGGVRKQRLIVDCRRVNAMFGPPDKVSLATGQALGSIEVDSGKPVRVPVMIGQVDIKDAFYNMLLPADLRAMFCLPPLTAMRAGVKEVNGEAVKGERLLYPVFRCVPMGFSHALWFCQVAHESAAAAGHDLIGMSTKISDRGRGRILRGSAIAHTEYVDNFGVFSLDRAKVTEVLAAVDAELGRRGWPRHPQEVTAGGDILGWRFDDSQPRMSVSPARVWRLRLGLRALLRRGHCTGEEMRCIIGACTFAALVRRESLSCFSAVYAYIETAGSRRLVLWDAVRRELRWFSALLPLLSRSLDAPWNDKVYVTDASLWGRGVCYGLRDPSVVAAAGRVSERWRFNCDEEAEIALQSSLGESAYEARVTAGGKSSTDHEEVPAALYDGEWQTASAGRWRESESMPILEGRALVWSLRHSLRSSECFGKRCFFLSDSMTQVLALSKGRSSTPKMNHICRQWGAMCLAGNVCASVRWIKSEQNAADEPSRMFEPKRMRKNAMEQEMRRRRREQPDREQEAESSKTRQQSSECLEVGSDLEADGAEQRGVSRVDDGSAMPKVPPTFQPACTPSFDSCAVAASGASSCRSRPNARTRHRLKRQSHGLDPLLWELGRGGSVEGERSADPASPISAQAAAGLATPESVARRCLGGGLARSSAPVRPTGQVGAEVGERVSEARSSARKTARDSSSREAKDKEADLLGAEVAEEDLPEVCAAVRRVQHLRSGASDVAEHSFKHRRGSDRVLECPVLQGRDAGHRRRARCGDSEVQPEGRAGWQDISGEVAVGGQGVPKPLPGGDEAADPLGSVLRAGGGAGEGGRVQDGLGDSSLLRSLPSGIGAVKAAGRPDHPADSRRRAGSSLLVGGPASVRKERAVQGGHERRGPEAGRRDLQVPRDHPHEHLAGRRQRRESVHLQLRGVVEAVQAGRRDRAAGGPGAANSASAEAWRSIDRCGGEDEGLGQHSGGRALGGRPLAAPLRQRRPGHPAALGARCAGAAQDAQGREVDWRDPLGFLPGFVQAHGPVALELFSGSGRFSKAFRREAGKHGLAIFEWDIRWGLQYDLQSQTAQRRLRGWVQAGWIRLIWIGIPCTSFSSMQNLQKAGPMRSAAQPWGLSGLSAHRQASVSMSNALVRFVFSLLLICRRRDTIAVVENPHASLLWVTPLFAEVLSWKSTREFVTDFCQFGVPWRKRTRLLCLNAALIRSVRRCSGSSGLCSRTHCKHTILQGTCKGIARTLLAEPYPEIFVRP